MNNDKYSSLMAFVGCVGVILSDHPGEILGIFLAGALFAVVGVGRRN